MFVQPPRRRQLVPPTDEAREAATAEAARMRAEFVRREEQARPFKQAVLACGGPALRDPEAALGCHCGCHPKPASFATHEGGVNCPCQQDPAERRRAFDEFLTRVRSDIDVEQRAAEAERAAAFAAVAAELSVTAEIVVSGAPFVVSGVCDGRGFYLRERHGHWRVTIAPDEDPAADPWTMAADEPTYDIASGDEDDLCDADGRFSPAQALRIAVEAVRTVLRRRACSHTDANDPAHLYCARCGIRLTDVGRWT